MKSIVCFDIGGTNVKYAVLSIDKQILEKSYFKTNIHNGQDVLKEMCRVIEDYKMRYDIIGVTISSPGFVNTKLGVIESGNIIDGFNGLNIKKYFEEKYPGIRISYRASSDLGDGEYLVYPSPDK